MSNRATVSGIPESRTVDLPSDYVERVYAGVLGKLIGVYLGRPVEGWTYDEIMRVHGEVDHYLPGRFGEPLVITDDDITGTFTFLRALADNGYSRDLTPQHIANGWLNYTIEERTIFWWGGIGNSTEHTAYLRMKSGIGAPESGSRALNGKVISEQIGSQIFIDGWGMVAPGDPEYAADLARRAASVSHDGEAIYGAQVIAAMEAQAFVESELNVLLDTAVALIPVDSDIAHAIHDVREWHATLLDWRAAREQIAANYGYDKFVGPCHMVPNHALIIMSLLYGDDDFRRSLMIVNTSGWDTDCNSGNVGCLLAIKNGLRTLESDYDWRGPVADRLYLPTADGGRAITDAVIESYHVVNGGRALAGLEALAPKSGARFHFELPGSVQGFQVTEDSATIENIPSGSVEGLRSLRIGGVDGQADITTATFIPLDASVNLHYELLSSPTLYSGQLLRIALSAPTDQEKSLDIAPLIRVYNASDTMEALTGPSQSVAAGEPVILEWTIPDTGGYPIAEVGVRINGTGEVLLDSVDWQGAPTLTLDRPDPESTFWRRAWVNGVDQFDERWPEPYRIVSNHGTGLISQGTADWHDYRAESSITINLARSGGIALRVQGLRRYYAVVLVAEDKARLVRAWDSVETLAEIDFPWTTFDAHTLAIEAKGNRIQGWIDGEQRFDVLDDHSQLQSGGVGLVVEEGCLSSGAVQVGTV